MPRRTAVAALAAAAVLGLGTTAVLQARDVVGTKSAGTVPAAAAPAAPAGEAVPPAVTPPDAVTSATPSSRPSAAPPSSLASVPALAKRVTASASASSPASASSRPGKAAPAQTRTARTAEAGAAPRKPRGGTSAMPVGDVPGWRQVFAEDFSKPAPLGSFARVYGVRFAGYEGHKDTSGNGLYSEKQVLSVKDGVLDYFVRTENGRRLVAAPVPNVYGKWKGQTYGRYSVRFRADPVRGYKTAWLLWPDSERWPMDGEIDWVEGRLDKTFYGASFYTQRTHKAEKHESGVTYGDWHVATLEWTPGKVEWFVDGRSIGTTTTKVPTKPMHLVLQTETSNWGDVPSPSARGHVEIDWVVQYARR